MKDNQVFPIVREGKVLEQGITKREYFAAAAMTGLLAAGDCYLVAKRAIDMADEVLQLLQEQQAPLTPGK